MPTLELNKMLGGVMALGDPVAQRPDSRRGAAKRQLKATLRRLAQLKGESLQLYRALPRAERFHASRARIRLLDGSNQAGRTLAGMCEIARAVTGCDPYQKYPKTGLALCVGYDAEHIASPMWRSLAREGAFNTIRDEQTKLWRSVRLDPNDPLKLDPYDAAYREKWREAPPLLPERWYKNHVAWEDRGKDIPRHVTIPKTGWKILFRSSKGDAVRGIQINLWQFDEEIKNYQFLPEALRGCMRFDGVGFWTATPQSGGVQLYELHERALAEDKDVEAFPLYIFENPFYTDESKQAFYDSLSEDERRVRWHGEYALVGRRVYPTYDPQGIHGYEPREIPPDWCVYVIVDPGSQHCGTIFLAVDPDEAHVWIYDGFDLRSADARRWAGEVKKREPEQGFHAFVMDLQMGRQRSVGMEQGTNVAKEYYEGLKEAGCLPQTQGPLGGFFPGSNDIPGREEALRGWLSIRGTGPFAGTPKLQVARGCVSELDRQMKRAHMIVDRPDQREKKYPEDVLVTLEYGAAFDPRYYAPEPRDAESGDNKTVYERFQAKRRSPRHSGGAAQRYGSGMVIG